MSKKCCPNCGSRALTFANGTGKCHNESCQKYLVTQDEFNFKIGPFVARHTKKLLEAA